MSEVVLRAFFEISLLITLEPHVGHTKFTAFCISARLLFVFRFERAVTCIAVWGVPLYVKELPLDSVWNLRHTKARVGMTLRLRTLEL